MVLLNKMFGKAGGASNSATVTVRMWPSPCPAKALGFGKNILNVAGMRSSPFLSLIKLFLLWISRTLVRGSCPVPSLPRSDWVPRSVQVLTLAFLRRLVLLLARGGAGALDSGSASLGSVRTVLVLFLLNRLVLFLARFGWAQKTSCPNEVLKVRCWLAKCQDSIWNTKEPGN